MVNHFGIDSILLSDRMRMSIIKVMRTSVFEAEKGIFFLSFFCIPDGVKKCVENLKQSIQQPKNPLLFVFYYANVHSFKLIHFI